MSAWGYVYFIRAADEVGPVKIGCSVRPHDRLREFRKHSPVPLEIVAKLEADSPALESRFHAFLWGHRSHGEWFHPTPDVLAVLAAVRSGTFDVSLLPAQGRLASVSSGNNREGGIAGAFKARLAKLKAAGLHIPEAVQEAAWTYGCSPEEKGRRRAIVREFVEANWPARITNTKAA